MESKKLKTLPLPGKTIMPTFWLLGFDSGFSLTGFSVASLVLGGDGEVVSHPLLQTGDLADSVVRLDVLHPDPLFAGLLAFLHTVAGDLGSTVCGGWLPLHGHVVWTNAGCLEVSRRSRRS